MVLKLRLFFVSLSSDKGETAIGNGLKFPLVISTSIKAHDLIGIMRKKINKYLKSIIIPLTSLLHQSLIVNPSISHTL